MEDLSTDVDIDSDVYETTPGGNVELTVTETNDGSAALTNVSVVVTYDSTTLVTLNKDNVTSGDTTNPGVLDVDETWIWDSTTEPLLQTTISVDTTFSASGSGDYTYDGTTVTVNVANGDAEEEDSVLVEVEEGFARTWGFWKTHLYLVQYIFDLNDDLDLSNDLLTLPIDLGTWDTNGPKAVEDVCDYMALMWANQSNNSDGSKRTKIDAARIHTAQQALAAIMNSYMPNGADLDAWLIDSKGWTGSDALSIIADTLTDGSQKDIRDLGSDLAEYNESGEGVALYPSLPPTGKTSGNIADPQDARLAGASCEAYWNTEVDTSRGKN